MSLLFFTPDLPEDYQATQNYNSTPQSVGLALPEVVPLLMVAHSISPDFLAEL